MVKWCENTGNNSMIVCLDQEKAYDRIDLNYLWRALEAFSFPNLFIQRVRNLYRNALTAICINGFLSEHFDMRRGVHQGDPMSCLLYNLAIKLLIENIQESMLRGFQVNTELERDLVKVYVDDVTIFLGPEDKPKEMQACLDLFCNASMAHFNSQKAEIIPVGTREFHSELTRTREFNGWTIEEEIHIVKDREATRILGLWQGNGTSTQMKWNKIMERQAKTMRLWSLMYPSITGRILVVKALVISLAYYLMTVNGIPWDTLSDMEKNIPAFIWSG